MGADAALEEEELEMIKTAIARCSRSQNGCSSPPSTELPPLWSKNQNNQNNASTAQQPQQQQQQLPFTTSTTPTAFTTTTGTPRRADSAVDDDDDAHHHDADATYRNFGLFAVLFSANHSAGLACLALASSRLGTDLAARQTGILYVTYTGSALSGVTCYVMDHRGSKAATVLGMWLFGGYVASFFVAASSAAAVEDVDADVTAVGPASLPPSKLLLVYVGAALGGLGAGLGWTAEGVYFTQAAEVYAMQAGILRSEATGRFAGIFAFAILVGETTMDVLSTILVRWWKVPWSVVFAAYATSAVLSTVAMHVWVWEYPSLAAAAASDEVPSSMCYKVTAALRLLLSDSKMKYMIGFNVAFGLAGAFLNSFVSGEVVPRALNDVSGSYIGLLVAIHGVVAAVCSLLFGRLSETCFKKEFILVLGALSFASVAAPFLFRPILEEWTWSLLILVYSLEGVGRATFEGTLKAVFADYFPYEKPGAFANIILQYGLASASAYGLSNRLRCSTQSKFCIKYRNETLHDLFSFVSLIMGASLIAIAGLLRAAYLFETDNGNRESPRLRLRSRAINRYSLSSALAVFDKRTYQTLETTVPREEIISACLKCNNGLDD